MKVWAELSQDNKVKIMLLFIAAMISSVGFFLKEQGYFSASAIAEEKPNKSSGGDGSGNTINGSGIGNVNMGDGNSINISSGNSVTNDSSVHSTDNSIKNIDNSVKNIDNSVRNIHSTTNIEYKGPTEEQKAAEAKRKEKAAFLKRKKEIYKKFSDSYQSSSVFTLDPDSLADALNIYSQSKTVLSDIELAFSLETQQKAQAFFDNARKTIACSWGERNQPKSCDLNSPEHPEGKYKTLFAALKSEMAGDISRSQGN